MKGPTGAPPSPAIKPTTATRPRSAFKAQPCKGLACSSAKKEKRRRRNPANGTHPDLAIVMAPECF
jgi:hypothetical protein